MAQASQRLREKEAAAIAPGIHTCFFSDSEDARNTPPSGQRPGKGQSFSGDCTVGACFGEASEPNVMERQALEF